MTEELKQAAQQALAEKFEAMHANGDAWITTIAAAKLCRALTQRPAAQEEAFCIYPKCLTTGGTCKGDCSKVPAPQQATPEPDDDGPEFTVSDPDLNNLLNLAADMAKGRCNHDTGMAWLQALEAVEARLKSTPAQQAAGEPVGQAPSVWNSLQIASWIGSQLMREPSMFERNAVCKFVRSLGRHPTLLKHSPKDTRHAPAVPEGFALVPVEPTQEMIDALNSSVSLPNCYRAMLAAARAKKGG